MKAKHFFGVAFVTFIFSFLLEGINDPNVFAFSKWRQNNVVNILQFWFTFVSTYYIFLLILNLGLKKLDIINPKKLIALLAFTQLIAFLWVIGTDILFYKLYYNIQSLSETTFFEFDLPLAIVVLSMGSFYFYQKNVFKTIPDKDLQRGSKTAKEKQIEAFLGSKKLWISPSEIYLLYVENKIVWVLTREKEIFSLGISISALIEELSPSEFFRINRQTILARKVVKGFRRLNYQKLEVILNTELNKDLNLVVSKYNAPIFKKWLSNN